MPADANEVKSNEEGYNIQRWKVIFGCVRKSELSQQSIIVGVTLHKGSMIVHTS